MQDKIINTVSRSTHVLCDCLMTLTFYVPGFLLLRIQFILFMIGWSMVHGSCGFSVSVILDEIPITIMFKSWQ